MTFYPTGARCLLKAIAHLPDRLLAPISLGAALRHLIWLAFYLKEGWQVPPAISHARS